MASVQFWGSKAVIQAFEARGIETWSIMQGKDLNMSGSGSEELRSYLDMLSQFGSGACYKLQVYAGEIDPDEITNKTPSNGAFNFMLGEKQGSVGGTGDPAVYKRLEELEKKVSGADDSGTIKDALISWLYEPEKLVPVVNAIGALFKGNTAGAIAQLPAMLGNVEPKRVNENTTMSGPVISDEEKIQRLAACLDRLEKADKNILFHLEKLAAMAEKNPAQFNMLVGMLNGM